MQPEQTSRRSDGILARLKEETAHQHKETEENVDIMREGFSLDDYRNLLVKFYSFYKPFEEKMSEAISANEIDFNHSERLNTPKLESDLNALGMSDEDISKIETTDDLPNLDSGERIFGSLYVIEGSTLGGQVISRHLKQTLDIDASNGSAFFSGYGEHTRPMWMGFMEAINKFADQTENHNEIITGANDTFEKLGISLKAN